MRRFPVFLLCAFLASCTPVQEETHKGPLTIFQPEHIRELGTGAVIEGPTIATGEVEYGSIDGKILKGFIAIPPGDGPFPALVLIHEWWGLNDNIRRNAQAFAQNGYVALAVDLFGESTTNAERARALANGVQANTAKAFTNVQQAVDFLVSDAIVDDKALGSVGWGFGGGWSYEMAKKNLGMRVSILYYGPFKTDDDLAQVKSLILGHFGESDTTIPVALVGEFREKLLEQSQEHEIYVYPNAGQSFTNNDSPVFDPAAADVAWDRTLDFLQKTLPTE
ncbi:MAG TPA: dienelactone hydrolase family protein [Candidatus Peribacteraceae bacterium]|nr:dienelactone hydrolase family protein [Candidatus Peribacteraceae bacterium]